MPLDATAILTETDVTDPKDDSRWSEILDGPEPDGIFFLDQLGTDDEPEDPGALEDERQGDDDNDAPAPAPIAVDLADANAAHLKRIQAARAEITQAVGLLAAAKEAHKDAKTAWEASIDRLTTIIDAGPDRYPLFEAMEATAATVDPPATGATVEVAEDDDSWRVVTLQSIGTPPGICRLLAANPGHSIATIGDLSGWTVAHAASGNPLGLVPKMGPKKIDQLTECLDRFWQEHAKEGRHG